MQRMILQIRSWGPVEHMLTSFYLYTIITPVVFKIPRHIIYSPWGKHPKESTYEELHVKLTRIDRRISHNHTRMEESIHLYLLPRQLMLLCVCYMQYIMCHNYPRIKFIGSFLIWIAVRHRSPSYAWTGKRHFIIWKPNVLPLLISNYISYTKQFLLTKKLLSSKSISLWFRRL